MPIGVIAVVVVAASVWGTLGVVLLLVAMAAAAAAIAYRRIRVRQDLDDDSDLPPLLFPAGSHRQPPAARPPAGFRGTAAPAGPGTPPTPAEPLPTIPVPHPGAGRAAAADLTAPGRPAAGGLDRDGGADVAGAAAHVGQVHFHRPPEGTLQLLPGRLEILAGTERVDEIRFLKVPGQEPAVTFGRATGEAHLHVQLEAPTVSRMHARMSFQGGRWRIANLSRTNPIVVNGEQLPLDANASAVLEDGDCLEMGQVVFRFRMR